MHKTEILNGIFKFSNGKRTKIIRRKKVERKSNESEDTKKISRNVFTIPWNWEGKKRDGGVQLSHYNAKPPFRVESTRGKGSDTPATWLKVSKGGCSFLQSLQIAKDICQIHPADGANKQRWREKEGGGGGRIFCRCIWSPIQFFRIKDGWNEFTGQKRRRRRRIFSQRMYSWCTFLQIFLREDRTLSFLSI